MSARVGEGAHAMFIGGVNRDGFCRLLTERWGGCERAATIGITAIAMSDQTLIHQTSNFMAHSVARRDRLILICHGALLQPRFPHKLRTYQQHQDIQGPDSNCDVPVLPCDERL